MSLRSRVALSLSILAIGVAGAAFILPIARAIAADETLDSSALPRGMVAFFSVAECPRGWAAFENARGRYVVGLREGGTLGAIVPETTPLSDKENRPVGGFRQDVGLLGLGGCGSATTVTTQYPGADGRACVPNDHGLGVYLIPAIDTHQPEGTNAPYVQLLACERK